MARSGTRGGVNAVCHARFAVPRELVAERAVRMLVALLDGHSVDRHVLVDAIEVNGGTVTAPPARS